MFDFQFFTSTITFDFSFFDILVVLSQLQCKHG